MPTKEKLYWNSNFGGLKECDVTAETDISFVGRVNYEFIDPNEFLFYKKEENKTWFWNKEEAISYNEKQEELQNKIKELQSQLV